MNVDKLAVLLGWGLAFRRGRVPEGHAVSQLGRKLPLVVSPVGLDPPGVAPPTRQSLQYKWLILIVAH